MWWMTPALHELDDGAWQGKEALGNQHEVLDAQLGGGLEDHVRDEVAVAEVVVGANGHAVAEPRGLTSALLDAARRACRRRPGSRALADRRRRLAPVGAMLADALVGHLRSAVDLDREPSRPRRSRRARSRAPLAIVPAGLRASRREPPAAMARLGHPVCSARLTTGGSIILLPEGDDARGPSPGVLEGEDDPAAPCRSRPASGAKASWMTRICRGWMQPLPSKPSALASSTLARRPVHVVHVGEDGVDGLHAGGARRVDDLRARPEALAALGRALGADVGGVVLEADGESATTDGDGGGDLEGAQARRARSRRWASARRALRAAHGARISRDAGVDGATCSAALAPWGSG